MNIKFSKTDFIIITALIIDCLSLFIFGFTFGALFVDVMLAYIVIWLLLGSEKQSGFIKAVRNIMLAVFLIWLMSFIIIESYVVTNGKADADNESGYLVILGAGLKGEVPSISLERRLDKAAEYLKTHKDMKVIVSGGQGKDEHISEAEAMKRFLVNKDISKDRIIKEDRSTSTYENLKFTKDILDSMEDKRSHEVILITSNYHIFRTKLLAERIGLNINAVPADTPLDIYINYCIREYFAIMNTFLSGIIEY